MNGLMSYLARYVVWDVLARVPERKLEVKFARFSSAMAKPQSKQEIMRREREACTVHNALQSSDT